MLARLDRCPGVETARTNWSGDEIALDVAADAPRAAVLDAVRAALGPDLEPTPLDAAATREAIAAIDSGAWFRHDECFALSAFEAKELARKWTARVCAKVPLDAASRATFEKAIEEGWLTLFRRYHAEEDVLGSESQRAFWRGELDRVILLLPAERAAAVRRVVKESWRPPRSASTSSSSSPDTGR